jgi:hypothetical protein
MDDKFAEAFMKAFPEHAEAAKTDKGLPHPEAFAVTSSSGDGFCSLWNKWEPQAERLLGWFKIIAPGPCAFLLALMQAAKTTVVPAICGGAAQPEVKTNIKQSR